MSVYVDQLFNTEGWSDKWPYKQACHCWADRVEELHSFCVGRLNMKLTWFQNKPFFPHYDLTATMRRKAVKLGAIEMHDTAAHEHSMKLKAAAKEEEEAVLRPANEALLRSNSPGLSVFYKGEKLGTVIPPVNITIPVKEKLYPTGE